MSVRVTDRHNSYFEITLTICGSPNDMAGTYMCEAGNEFGSDSATHSVTGIYTCLDYT